MYWTHASTTLISPTVVAQTRTALSLGCSLPPPPSPGNGSQGGVGVGFVGWSVEVGSVVMRIAVVKKVRVKCKTVKRNSETACRYSDERMISPRRS